ncbi:phospho-N-acetylmuramoyl-pentapeptide-transferase homolog [Citrus clementina]|uniref:phospho-N-acetylmuramoyl-pentapeptide- transferase homolog n=1 Tax=Citrus clementina TaxID=85681 RepID=UPI000CED62E1|nr:phospho-N-acetylmuramoyl-pentapeptide-transferase homolog [Citrus x clementina]
MRSCSSFQRHSQSHLGHFRARRSSSLIAAKTSCRFRSGSLSPELNGSKSNVSRTHGYQLQYAAVQVRAFNDDFDFASFDNWSDNEGTVGHMVSSSEGEESDGEIVLNSISDTDLPSVFVSNNDALTLTAHRLAMIGRARRRHRIKLGLFINLGLITFLTVLLLFVDWCAWKIVRLPLAPFYLTRPFFISAVLVSCAGYICVPLLKSLKIRQIIRKEGPARHSRKGRTPTMGGLFFVPIGIAVTIATVGFSSLQVSGASAATLAIALIGLIDDVICLVKNHSSGLSAWSRLILEVAVGTWFSFWLEATSIPSPYGMKMLVPLPAPLGLLFLGKFYLLLTSFTFVSMGNGVNLTDGLDGLAGGTAALAFIGMSIAVLPICSELSIFGASMAGACVGFLLHNRYRASVFMGDTIAIIFQVLYFKITKHLLGGGRRLFRMAPFHHHLELCGLKEPMIVAGAYVISSVLALFAGYVGLIAA